MTPTHPSNYNPCTMLRRTLLGLLVVASSIALSSPAVAQTCNRAGCGTISCGTPATTVPRSFWGELQPADSSPLPPGRDATAFDEFRQSYSGQNWYMGVDTANGYLFTGMAYGLQIWDTRTTPANPTVLGHFSFSSLPIWIDSPEDKLPLVGVAVPAGVDTIAALVGDAGVGVSFIDTTNKGTPRLLYQSYKRDAEEVYAATIGGSQYAFVAAAGGQAGGGLYAYNMSQARQYSGCFESVPFPGDPVNCPGVYLGKIGSKSSALYVHGVDNFVVDSAGAGSGIEIWNVANPSSPQLRLTGLNDPPTCSFDRRSTYGVAMWKGGTHYYLGLRTSNFACPVGPTVNEARIYDVSCIASGPCSLGNPVWSTVLTDEGTPNYFVTLSQSGATPFLYFGSDNKCSGGVQREWLFDVSIPAAARDITPPGGYWGWYYRGGLTGFNLVMPRRGKFVGNYFYRAGLSIMDIHQHTGGVAPLADFSWSPTEIYPGTAVNFQDLSLPTPTSWSWTFQDGTPASSTTTSPQGVTFATPGSKSVSLAVANGVGPGNTTKSVTVLDPTPVIGAAVETPASPLVCQPVTFSATGVTGRPTLSYSWVVTNALTSATVASGTGPSLVWSTGASTSPGSYTGTLTVSNTAGNASKSVGVTLSALPPLAFSGASGAPENDPFSAGTVQLHARSQGATAWNWDYGDGAGFTGYVSDPIAGPDPLHVYLSTGVKNVRVKIMNCVSGDVGAITSQTLTINILQTTPLIANFAAQCAFAPCSFSAGSPITFLDSSTGATLWDYDWSHADASAGTCNFTDAGHTSPVVSHTYPSAGNFQPCLRVRRGTSENNVFVHGLINVGSAVPPSLTINGPTQAQINATLNYSASASNCDPSAGTWNWLMAGGSPASSAASVITLSYATSGTKTITVTNTACSGAFGSLSVVVSGGTDNNSLGAAFSFSPGAPKVAQAVTFDASTSTGSPTAYTWSYGDNTNDVGKTVTHSYAAAGNYVVTLTITKPGTGAGCFSGTCVSQTVKTVVVGGGGPPPLDPEFTTAGATCTNQFGFDQCNAAANATVTLTASSTQATSFAWDFGDGTTGSGTPVTHAWTQAGSYTVKLTVSAAGQADASKARSFVISAAQATVNSVLLPFVAQSRGALVQSSDLYVHNPGTAPIDVTLSFRKRGTPDVNPPIATRTIAPGATLFSSDVLSGLFNREDIAGFVDVVVSKGVTEPIITSFNTTFGSGGKEFGQTIAGISMSHAGSSSISGPPAAAVQHVVGLSDDSEEIGYFGVTNPNGAPATFNLHFFDSLGKEIGHPASLTISRFGQRQFQMKEIRETFGVSNIQDYRVQVETQDGSQVYPFGATLRSVSNDPSLFGAGATQTARVYILGALSTPGLNNSLWKSDVVITNTSNQVVLTTMTFNGVGPKTAALSPVALTLQPGETQRLSDVLGDKWGIKNAVGWLTFESDSPTGVFPIVQAESYDFATGTRQYGQSMVARTDADAAGAGQGHYMVGLRQDATHWTAMWLFNPSTEQGSYDLIYRRLDGTILGQVKGYAVPAGKARFFRPNDHPLPAAGVPDGFTLQIVVHSGKILAAGQVVSTTTNDPAYIVGQTR